MSGFEVPRTAACDPVEELLPEIARAIRDGDDPAAMWPAAARHVEECARCAAIVAELARRPEVDDVPEIPVEPSELIQRALVTGLGDADAIVRMRAASRLGAMELLPLAALAALADAAVEDPDERVRSASLDALDRLDEHVSIPRRIIEMWSASPEGAAPFIGGVLARLGGRDAPSHRGVTELVSGKGGKRPGSFTGPAGARGRLVEEQNQLWLSLDHLPGEFENTRPVVAIPDVMEESRLEWSSEQPGLVTSGEPVEGGAVRVPLASVVARGIAEKMESFRRIYLLNPEAKRTPHQR